MASDRMLVAMPTRGTPHPRAFAAMMGAVNRVPTASVMYPEGAPRDYNRNCIVQWFLDAGKHEWLLMVDDDSIIPPDVIEKMLGVGKSVVAAPQPLYFPPDGLVANLSAERGPDGKGYVWPSWHDYDFEQPPHKLLACGFGCVLMRRDVLERMERPWFQENYGDFRGKGNVTEDIWFCERLLAMGEELWACPSAICGHFKWVDLREMLPRAAIKMTKSGQVKVLTNG